MKRILIILCVILLPLTASAGTEDSKFTKHYDESIFKVTEKGLFSIEMVLKGKKLTVGRNSIDLIIHDKEDKDVVGADLIITPWMPSMGHGVAEKPDINEKGGGLYAIENVVFSMKGHWELRVNVKKNGAEDRAVFSFADVQVGHEREMHHGEVPSEMDMSRTRMSQKKVFRVTYESQLEPVTVNKIHSVKLKVETSDGRPVDGAEIEIDGDMPAHGHGLPTEPEVTQELGDGYYLVEGMKFSMPGHWVIEVEIEAGETEDTATFNLNLK